MARVHARVGDHGIVILPDGRLVTRTNDQAEATQRPFQPATQDELADQLTAQLPGFRTKKTKCYLFVYNTSDQFAKAATRIMQSMYPGVVAFAKNQRIKIHDLQVPLVVIMFRTEAEFQRFQRMPPGIAAYYNTISNQVVMKEETEIGKIKPQLGIQQSLSTMAHEGAHQILHNIGVQQRLSVWPIWLAEGFAEYLAPTATGARMKWKGAGGVNDMRMFELEQYVKSRAADSTSGDMIEHTVGAAKLTSAGYATSWALTHYLAQKHRDAFNKYVHEVSKTGPLTGSYPQDGDSLVAGNKQLFSKYFGDDFPGLEKQVLDYLGRLTYRDPFAEYPHFVATVVAVINRKPAREANVFLSSSLASRWAREQVAKLPAENRGRVVMDVKLFRNRVLAEEFARRWVKAR